MRKALFIGIDKYYSAPLECCVNDAVEMEKVLSLNFDETRNFESKILLDKKATRKNIRKEIKELFSGTGEIALLYFSGHGVDDKNDGIIASYDYEQNDYGIKFSEILQEANDSAIFYKVIILDCCHSGFFGNNGEIGDISHLNSGVVVMTASTSDQLSLEVDGHGVFTNLLIQALEGGASDILGNITPGSIYAYVDQALGSWGQRPLFKANINSFVSLRKFEKKISEGSLRECMQLFDKPDSVFKLDPSFEKTNYPDSGHRSLEPYAINNNVRIMTELQKCNRNGLVVPFGSPDMYFAAMESKGCKLTPLGKHYWNMVKNGII